MTDGRTGTAPRDLFRWLYLGGLAITGIGMPWGEFLMSIGQFIVFGGWLAEGMVRGSLTVRVKQAFAQPAVLWFLSFFFLHLFGLLWTTDLTWGWDVCRTLLPVLVLTPVVASSPPLLAAELRALLLLFTASTITSTFACLALNTTPDDHRALSHFISHIRLSLMVCMAVFILVKFWPGRWHFRALHLLAGGWCVYFLQLLGSITGLVVLLVVAGWWLWRSTRPLGAAMRWGLRTALVVLPGLLVHYIVGVVTDAHRIDPAERMPLAATSPGGEPYAHDTTNLQLENGRYVWRNIAWAEVHRAWERMGNFPLDSMDHRGHVFYGTLFRYMTSKGLTKDSVGMAALSQDDLSRIMNGEWSAQQRERNALELRIRELVFEEQRLRNTGVVSGSSSVMRLEFWKTGWHIFKQYPLAGVGTGDTKPMFAAAYDELGSQLDARWRLRAHNQFLTWAISFGSIGLVLCVLAWLLPVRLLGAWREPLFVAWSIAFGLSCLTEDTLETQAGATYAVWFYVLLVFGTGTRAKAAATVDGPEYGIHRSHLR